MSNQFISIERDQPMVIPVQEWLTAMGWDYANRLEAQLQAEVEALLQQAEAGHTEPLPGLRVADELVLRQARLQQIGAVKREKIEVLNRIQFET